MNDGLLRFSVAVAVVALGLTAGGCDPSLNPPHWDGGTASGGSSATAKHDLADMTFARTAAHARIGAGSGGSMVPRARSSLIRCMVNSGATSSSNPEMTRNVARIEMRCSCINAWKNPRPVSATKKKKTKYANGA